MDTHRRQGRARVLSPARWFFRSHSSARLAFSSPPSRAISPGLAVAPAAPVVSWFHSEHPLAWSLQYVASQVVTSHHDPRGQATQDCTAEIPGPVPVPGLGPGCWLASLGAQVQVTVWRCSFLRAQLRAGLGCPRCVLGPQARCVGSWWGGVMAFAQEDPKDSLSFPLSPTRPSQQGLLGPPAPRCPVACCVVTVLHIVKVEAFFQVKKCKRMPGMASRVEEEALQSRTRWGAAGCCCLLQCSPWVRG